MSQKATAALAAARERYGAAEASQGGGLGPWPPAGEHDCLIVKLEVDENHKWTYDKDAQGQKKQVDAIQYQFTFQLLEDPDNPSNPLTFKGAPFVLPLTYPSDIPAGYLTMVEINRNRLAGHCKCILDKEVEGDTGISLDEALTEVAALLGGQSHICVTVNCQYDTYISRRTKKEMTSKNEFLLRRIAAAG